MYTKAENYKMDSKRTLPQYTQKYKKTNVFNNCSLRLNAVNISDRKQKKSHKR